MKELMQNLLTQLGMGDNDYIYASAVIILIVLISLIIHWLFHKVVMGFLRKNANNSEQQWKHSLYKNKLFPRIKYVFIN